MKNKILIVDDEQELVEVMKTFFQYEGYSVTTSFDGENALRIIDDSYDIVLLDVMMPKINGLDVCKAIRQKYTMPILFLTAKNEDQDQIEGFICGADDYITKPFTLPVLLHRIKALQNRCKNSYCCSDNAIISIDEMEIHINKNKLYYNNKEIKLTKIEFKMLIYLSSKNIVRSLKEIYEKVWDDNYSKSKINTVMVHLVHLKSKLPLKKNGEFYIKNIWGKGYIFDFKEKKQT